MGQSSRCWSGSLFYVKCSLSFFALIFGRLRCSLFFLLIPIVAVSSLMTSVPSLSLFFVHTVQLVLAHAHTTTTSLSHYCTLSLLHAHCTLSVFRQWFPPILFMSSSWTPFSFPVSLHIHCPTLCALPFFIFLCLFEVSRSVPDCKVAEWTWCRWSTVSMRFGHLDDSAPLNVEMTIMFAAVLTRFCFVGPLLFVLPFSFLKWPGLDVLCFFVICDVAFWWLMPIDFESAAAPKEECSDAI